jgi:beta-phosphoglucomutase
MSSREKQVFKACIFDLDGVIVDSAKYHFKAWKKMAKSLGIDFDESHNEQLKGVARMESLEYILSLGNVVKSDKEKENLAYNKNEMYLMLIEGLSDDDILPGVRNFLNELQDKKWQIALGSSSKNAVKILENLNLIDYFEVIIDGTKTTRSKPDPQVFEMGAEALGLEPKEIIVFEDAQKGIEAAKRGGFHAIGVGEWSSLLHADYVIPGFKDFGVEDILERIY